MRCSHISPKFPSNQFPSSGAAQSGVDTDAKATDTEAEDVERDTPCPPKDEIMSMENLEKELIEVEERMLLSNRITIDDGEITSASSPSYSTHFECKTLDMSQQMHPT